MPHPFQWLSDKQQARLLGPLIVCSLIAFVTVAALNQALETAEAPLGILSLQLAGDLTRAQAVIDSWQGDRRLYAGLNLGFDFLFLTLRL